MRKLVGLIGIGCWGALATACTGGEADASSVITIPNDIGWTPPVDNTPSAGTAGTSGTGGSSGAAGSGSSDDPAVNVTLEWRSSGCGQPLPPDQVPTVPGSREGYTLFTVMQTGETIIGNDPNKATPRDIFVRVPFDYDPNKAYPVVYIGIGCGAGTGQNASYPLFDEEKGGSEQAIYVGVSLPPNQPNGPCYDNRAGETSQEWEAFELFHTLVESTYCADNNRVFVGGYSTGGWLANMWGCYFAGINPARKFAPNFRIRGQAATTGNQPENNPDCNGPVAGIWIHDQDDTVNLIAGNIAGLDRVLEMNGCVDSPTEPWGSAEDGLAEVCERYTECPAEYPVIFCTTTGRGHSDQPERTIPGYTQFFEMMTPVAQ
jgi:hypothetical protein